MQCVHCSQMIIICGKSSQFQIIACVVQPYTNRMSNNIANDYNRQLGDVFLVFEYMEHNLGSLIEEKKVRNFTYGQVKGYMKQIFTGLFFCHTNKVLHRDIKRNSYTL